MVCNKQLSTGEELYVIDENKFVCKEDYLSSGAIKEVNLNSGKKKKREREAHTNEQNNVRNVKNVSYSI